MSVPAGDTVTLACRATGQPEPEITWTLNDVVLAADSERFHRTAEGALRIVNVDASCVGSYECRANNSVGMTRSRRARMAIDQPQSDEAVPELGAQKPTIALRPVGGTMSSRHALVLHCVANGENARLRSLHVHVM